MGLWFFLAVAISANYAFKAYKIRVLSLAPREPDRLSALEKELAMLKTQLANRDLEKRIERLEESVFFGDFDLKKQFAKLEKDAELEKRLS
jgi:hypothetical protein